MYTPECTHIIYNSVVIYNSILRHLNLCELDLVDSCELYSWYSEKDRCNPLLLTNIITENQFRLLVQGKNANHLNKSIPFQIRTLIDRTLPRHANEFMMLQN